MRIIHSDDERDDLPRVAYNQVEIMLRRKGDRPLDIQYSGSVDRIYGNSTLIADSAWQRVEGTLSDTSVREQLVLEVDQLHGATGVDESLWVELNCTTLCAFCGIEVRRGVVANRRKRPLIRDERLAESLGECVPFSLRGKTGIARKTFALLVGSGSGGEKDTEKNSRPKLHGWMSSRTSGQLLSLYHLVS